MMSTALLRAVNLLLDRASKGISRCRGCQFLPCWAGSLLV